MHIHSRAGASQTSFCGVGKMRIKAMEGAFGRKRLVVRANAAFGAPSGNDCYRDDGNKKAGCLKRCFPTSCLLIESALRQRNKDTSSVRFASTFPSKGKAYEKCRFRCVSPAQTKACGTRSFSRRFIITASFCCCNQNRAASGFPCEGPAPRASPKGTVQA